jgi:LuxR family maltose regulon positive regulatory protein
LVGALLGSAAPLVILSAPPGSGKTVALAQWAEQERRPVAWLRLDAADNDPAVCLSYLAVALDRVVGLDAEVMALLGLRNPPVQQILAGIAAALVAARPFLFVLDDAQLVQDGRCWDHIAFVLDQQLPASQVAIATRAEPPLPLARLRARGELAEFRLGELAFDRGEADELLARHGVQFDDAALDTLLDLTEGWATGLYLALLAGGGRAPSEWLPHVRGDQREIAAYLLGEVLECQPADLQAFLLQTSVLDELSASLCGAVTGRDDTAAVLTHLARENLFVTSLDDRDEWYRYHHLFAELLRSRLQRERPATLRGLHRRAAAWYAVNDSPVRATDHWLAAGDVHLTVDLVASACDRYLQLGHLESARRLLELFTDEQLTSEPSLTMTAGWVFGAAIGTADEERKWTAVACGMPVDDRPSPDGTVSLRSSQALLRAVLAPDGVTRMLEDARLGVRLETSPGQSGWCEFAHTVLGIARYLNGSFVRVQEPLTKVVEWGAGDPLAQSWALSYLALVDCEQGQWDRAALLASRAETLAPAASPELRPSYSMYLPLLLARARVLSRHDAPRTLLFAEGVDEYIGDMTNRAPWCVLMGRVMLGEVALEQGDLPLARRQSAMASATLAGYPDAGMLARRAVALAGALERRDLTEPVTRAEKRVLELLPTHLTTAQVGARLFVSRATVKTHLRAIYRKLGVGSRAEAVARARDLGLLKS